MTNYISHNLYEYISNKTQDPIVQWKTCRISGVKFPIFQSEIDFLKKISPVFNGKKYLIPLPTLCPEERKRRRLSFRNERNLYKRKCNATSKDIISQYKKTSGMNVYHQNVWWGDSRDGISFGQEYIGQNVFDILSTLLYQVPATSLFVSLNASENNCEYVNYAGNNKDCYLIFDSDENKACLYSYGIKGSEDCLDCMSCSGCSNCYEMIYCANCHSCAHCIYTTDSYECTNCEQCINCKNCVNCRGLTNKQYCIENKQYTKDEYQKLVKNIAITPLKSPKISMHITKDSYETCFGSGVTHSQNAIFFYSGGEVQDVRYATGLFYAHDCVDVDSFGQNLSWAYEVTGCGWDVHNIAFCTNVTFSSHDIYYSYQCSYSHHLFGCVGLKYKSYCIFNKQYTKDEYEKLVPQIIQSMQKQGIWGEFFDPSWSPFDYNETAAMDYLPWTETEAIKAGYKRGEETSHKSDHPNALQANQLPSLSQVDETILNCIILCQESSKPFRITKKELAFYRKHDVPLPRFHPDVRHMNRLSKLPYRSLYLRKSNISQNMIISVYPPDSQYAVLSLSEYMVQIYKKDS